MRSCSSREEAGDPSPQIKRETVCEVGGVLRGSDWSQVEEHSHSPGEGNSRVGSLPPERSGSLQHLREAACQREPRQNEETGASTQETGEGHLEEAYSEDIGEVWDFGEGNAVLRRDEGRTERRLQQNGNQEPGEAVSE